MKERFVLENEMIVPAIGFGTYNAKGGDNLQMIKDAIEAGYGRIGGRRQNQGYWA